MSPLQLFGLKHPMMVHFPIAAALFLVPAVLLAMREDEKHHLWGHSAHYLAWVGVAAFIPPILSGFLWAKGIGLIPAGAWIAPSAPPSDELVWLVRRHELVSLVGFLMGLATVWALGRRRERPGRLVLSLACAWLLATFATGYFGGKMTHPILSNEPEAAAADAPAPTAPAPSAELAPTR